jgi:predicted AAA+ superfamily ATPase
MYINREIEGKLGKFLKSPEIIAVVGPRQCGKTTLLKHIFSPLKKAVYIDFEDRDRLNLFNDDIKSFYALYVKGSDYLFIDEFQYASEGGQKLKYLYDTHKIKIFISGSSVLDLTHQAVKYLVGRVFIFQLYPFSFGEFLSHRGTSLYENIYLDSRRQVEQYIYGKRKSPPVFNDGLIREMLGYYYEYVVFGGYPRVVLTDDREEKITVLKNIYNTYLLREIRDVLQLNTEAELRKLIKALALQTGSMVVYNELGQISSLDYTRLMKHLNILEKTFLIKLIAPFCKNKRTEIAKTPKVYFWDNGFRNVVINNFQPMDERADRGALNENYAAQQLMKAGDDINYWRTKSNAEIDFVVEREGMHTALEVKSFLSSGKTSRSLYSFRDKYSVRRTVILSENYSFFDKKKDILFLPVFFI